MLRNGFLNREGAKDAKGDQPSVNNTPIVMRPALLVATR
jgi:hypothetical protein